MKLPLFKPRTCYLEEPDRVGEDVDAEVDEVHQGVQQGQEEHRHTNPLNKLEMLI